VDSAIVTFNGFLFLWIEFDIGSKGYFYVYGERVPYTRIQSLNEV